MAVEREPFNPDRMRHRDLPDDWNDLTKLVIRCAIDVHAILGPGLLEKLYEEALVFELRQAGLRIAQQVPVRIRYKSIELGEQRIDLLVNELLVIEIKAVEHLLDVHKRQLVSYLRSTDLPLGLLINFHGEQLATDVRRVVNSRSSRFPFSAGSLRVSPPSPLPPRSDLGAST